MMDSNGVQRLWGHDFRVVGGGLDESDVSAFVEDLLNQLQASIQKSDRLESLYALAESTLSGAERLASETPGRDETEIAQRPPPAAAEAEHLADEIIERAREAASALEASGRLKAQQKVTEVAETLQAMQLWAHEEFTKLMEYEERLDAFNTSFETFLALIGEGFPAEPARLSPIQVGEVQAALQRDRNVSGVPSGLSRIAAQVGEHTLHELRCLSRRVPGVLVVDRAPEGASSVAAHPDGNVGLLHRLGVELDLPGCTEEALPDSPPLAPYLYTRRPDPAKSSEAMTDRRIYGKASGPHPNLPPLRQGKGLVIFSLVSVTKRDAHQA